MRKHPSLYLRDDYKKLFLLGQFAFFRQVRGFFVRVEIIEWAKWDAQASRRNFFF